MIMDDAEDDDADDDHDYDDDDSDSKSYQVILYPKQHLCASVIMFFSHYFVTARISIGDRCVKQNMHDAYYTCRCQNNRNITELKVHPYL